MPALRLGVMIVALLLVCGSAAQAQRRSQPAPGYSYLQANVWQLGFSFGAGGQQLWVAPSVDVHYGDLTLRTVPGPFYFGGGVQYRLGKKIYATDCNHRPIYLSVGYLNDWVLSPLLRGASSTLVDQSVVPVMVGLRRNLNTRGTVYAEVGVGAAWRSDTRRAFGVESSQAQWGPMFELRLGLIQPRPARRYGR